MHSESHLFNALSLGQIVSEEKPAANSLLRSFCSWALVHFMYKQMVTIEAPMTQRKIVCKNFIPATVSPFKEKGLRQTQQNHTVPLFVQQQTGLPSESLFFTEIPRNPCFLCLSIRIRLSLDPNNSLYIWSQNQYLSYRDLQWKPCSQKQADHTGTTRQKGWLKKSSAPRQKSAISVWWWWCWNVSWLCEKQRRDRLISYHPFICYLEEIRLWPE